MSHTLIFLLALAAFAMLLLSMRAHQRQWLAHALSPRVSVGLRIGAAALLAFALVIAARSVGAAEGAILWCGWLTVAAAVVVAVNSRRGGRAS